MPFGSFITDSSASNFMTALWQYALEHKVKFNFDEDNSVFRMEIDQNACGDFDETASDEEEYLPKQEPIVTVVEVEV